MMGRLEKDVKNDGFCELSQNHGVVLISTQAGVFWGGHVKEIDSARRRVVLEPFTRPHGAPEGFPDSDGYQSVVVTPDMVGKRIAVFVGLEWKKEDGGELSEQQLLWLERMIADGAIAGVASSVEEAVRIVDGGPEYGRKQIEQLRAEFDARAARRAERQSKRGKRKS